MSIEEMLHYYVSTVHERHGTLPLDHSERVASRERSIDLTAVHACVKLTSHRQRYGDETVEFRHVGVGCVNCALERFSTQKTG